MSYVKMLLEDWGNLNAVSPEVRKILARNFGNRLGRDSKVEIIKGDGNKIYKILQTSYIGFVVRYGQDDLFLIKENYHQNWELQTLPDWLLMTADVSYNDRYDTYRKIKSLSGMVKMYRELVVFLSKLLNKPKDEIISKINYQVIRSDESRKEKQEQRRETRQQSDVVTKNGIQTPANAQLIKNYLKQRLKVYIENKLPQFNNINDLPKDTALFKKDAKFKLFGTVFEISKYTYENDVANLFLNKPVYISFENRERYNRKYMTYPDSILFQLKLENNRIVVTNILGMKSKYSVGENNDGNPHPLDAWSWKIAE